MANYDKDMAEERIQIRDDKQKIYEDDKKKRDAGSKMYSEEKGPKKKDCYGPKSMDPMYNGKPGVQQDDFEQFSKKGPKMGYDHGPKMTSDPKSYRSSMAKHWQASNSRFDMPIAHDEAGRAGEGNM